MQSLCSRHNNLTAASIRTCHIGTRVLLNTCRPRSGQYWWIAYSTLKVCYLECAHSFNSLTYIGHSLVSAHVLLMSCPLTAKIRFNWLFIMCWILPTTDLIGLPRYLPRSLSRMISPYILSTMDRLDWLSVFHFMCCFFNSKLC